MAYATVEELKAYINLMSGGTQTEFSEEDDELIQTFLDEATAEIDEATGRSFAGSEVELSFTEKSIIGDTLFFDQDMLSVATLTDGNGEVVAPEGYALLPLNSPQCYYGLMILPGYELSIEPGEFITVEGVAGFSQTPPASIKRITKRLAYFYWMKRATTGEVEVMGDGATRVPAVYPQDVASVLRRYKRGKRP